MLDSSKCIDLPGNSYQNGNQLWIWDCIDGSPGQQWGYDKSQATIYLASSGKSDATKCVDANQGGQNNGAAAQIWDCLGSDRQHWEASQYGHSGTDARLAVVL